MEEFKKFYNELILSSPKERRDKLNTKMSNLADSGINCSSCKGVCCSFIANSMKTTPIETLDLYIYLSENNRLNAELFKSLENTIKHYRLDYDIDTGRGTNLRRTYTCPFYIPGPKGCTISKYYKPYGCLAFNALGPNAYGENGCAPDFKLLEDREKYFEELESVSNKIIREKLGLTWDKLPMPCALMEIKKRFQ